MRAAAIGLLVLFFATQVRPVVMTAQGDTPVFWKPVLVGLALSLAGMVNRAMLFRAAHQGAGLSPSRADMLRTSTVGFAANKIVRTGGASGLAVFVFHGRRRDRPPAMVTVACALAAVGSSMALGLIIVATLGYVAPTLWPSWSTGAVCAFMLAAAGSIPTMASAASRVAGALSHSAARRVADLPKVRALIDRFGDDLQLALATVNREPRAAQRVVLHAIASKVLGALMLAVAALGAGFSISTETIVVVYAMAVSASAISILPGGMGIAESTTTGLLVAAGVAAPAAGLAIVLFRLFDLWLPVIAGLLVGRRDFVGRDRLRSSDLIPSTNRSPDLPQLEPASIG